MEIKIAHCADVHLGIRPSKEDYLSRVRVQEIKSSFFKMVDIVRDSKVDLFLIAGDLFDDVGVDDREVGEVKEAFAGLKTRIVISPGNHDPFTADSPYCSVWPDNVYIFKKNTIDCFEIRELETRVWGSAFTPLNNSGAKIKIKDDDKLINILVTHGTCSYGSDDLYNPISLVDIKASNMNYVALGHIHKRTPISHAGKTFYAYPGCLEGTGFKELGEKGFYIGNISNVTCKMDFIKVSKRSYLDLCIDITTLNSSVEVYNHVLFKIKDKHIGNYKNNIYKIILIGMIPDSFSLDTQYIKNKLQEELFFVKIENKTETYNPGNSNSLKSIFIEKAKNYIRNCEDDESRKVAQRALRAGIMSFSRGAYHDED